MEKITPFLWFNNQAEEAVNFYVSIFKNSSITSTSRYPEGSRGVAGQVMSMSFTLEGRPFTAFNGGPMFSFTPAISLFVDCADQAEVDELWNKLLEGGGQPSRCGWLTDRFGLSWQIIPKALGELMGSSDPNKSKAVMEAMLQMGKIDVDELQKAHDAIG